MGIVGRNGPTRASICYKGMQAHHSLYHVARGLPSLVTWHCRCLVEPRGMTMLTGGGLGRRLFGRRIMLTHRLLVQLSLVDPCFLLLGSHSFYTGSRVVILSACLYHITFIGSII